jgi:hypothetical protein
MRCGVGNSSWVEKNSNAVVDGIVGGAGVAMPKEPPTRFWVRERGVVRMFSEKMAVIYPVGEKIGAFWDGGALREVNLNEEPTGSKGPGWFV